MWSFKGSVTVMVFIMLGLVIGMYLLGFSSPMFRLVAEEVFVTDDEGTQKINEDIDIGNMLTGIKDSLMSTAGLMFFGFSIGMAFLTALAPGMGYASGSILSVMIPAFLLFLFANIFFFPVTSAPAREGLPFELSMILTVIFNALLLLTVLTFITGRE